MRLTLLESLLEGLKYEGYDLVTNYPGYESHKIFQLLGGKITSQNEKIAYETAYGVATANGKSIVVIKNVGLNDAADPFLNSLMTSVNGGLVLIVVDDTSINWSQSAQDSRHYFDFFGGIWFEPVSAQNAYDIGRSVFHVSNTFKIPVVIRLASNFLDNTDKRHAISKNDLKIYPSITNSPLRKENFSTKPVIHPINSVRQTKRLTNLNGLIEDWVESIYEETDSKNTIGNIRFGPTKALDLNENMDTLEIFTYPIPRILVSNFVKAKKRIDVYEDGSDFGYNKVIGVTTNNINSIKQTYKEPKPKYLDIYKMLYKAISKSSVDKIIGDLGTYTITTFGEVDVALSYGASTGVSVGYNILNTSEKVLTLCGDGAWLHSAKNAIHDAISHKVKLNVIVICNGGPLGTGVQQVPGELSMQSNVVDEIHVNYNDVDQIELTKEINNLFETNNTAILFLTIDT